MAWSNQRAVKAYVIGVSIVSLAVVFLAASAAGLEVSVGSADIRGVVAFACLGLVLVLLPHNLPLGNRGGTIAFVAYLGSAVTFGAFWGAIVTALCVYVGNRSNRRGGLKTLFNTAQHVLGITVGMFTYRALGGSVPATELNANIGPFFGLAITYFVLNSLLVSGAYTLSERKNLFEVWFRNTWGLAGYELVASALGLAVAWLYSEFDLVGMIGVVGPVIFLRHAYLVNVKLQDTNRELLDLMVKAIEARDPYTSGHSQRVSELARALATEMGLSFREVDEVSSAALLHDVGKIYEEFAPLLRKQGPLTDHERRIMETHPVRSAELVGTISSLRGAVVEVIKHHHEHFDGTGYPSGLKGTDIPLGSRIVMVADTTDAMTTSRPYRDALPFEDLVQELESHAGRQFDPSVVDAFKSSTVVRRILARREENPPRSSGWHKEGSSKSIRLAR